MLSWIQSNFANIIVCAVLAAVTALIVGGMIRNRRNGVSSCGCSGCTGCSGCVSGSACGKTGNGDARG
ncbi:MAG: FeoB-associated Cys-rich membrane protein [Oscillospiraceae bacterium]|nr:FeoB-associated Cys-rich membrane protein [Oscillospiraceae bacterium]